MPKFVEKPQYFEARQCTGGPESVFELANWLSDVLGGDRTVQVRWLPPIVEKGQPLPEDNGLISVKQGDREFYVSNGQWLMINGPHASHRNEIVIYNQSDFEAYFEEAPDGTDA